MSYYLNGNPIADVVKLGKSFMELVSNSGNALRIRSTGSS